MKHILTVLLTIVVTLAFCTNVYEAKAIEKGDEHMDILVAAIIDSQLSYEEKETLKNIDNTLSNESLLKVYNEISWSLAGKSSKEMIAKAEMCSKTATYTDYYVFSSAPYRIRVSHGQIATEDIAETPQYVKDIVALSNQVAINGKQLDVTGIYCFDGDNSHNGIIICILTQAEALIKYYENPYSEALLFSESEFQAYASDYYTYITSYENNYDENGEPIGGDVLSFKDFIEDRVLDDDDKNSNYISVINNLNENKDKDNTSSLLKRNHLYLWLSFVIILITGSTIIGTAFIKKQKNFSLNFQNK